MLYTLKLLLAVITVAHVMVLESIVVSMERCAVLEAVVLLGYAQGVGALLPPHPIAVEVDTLLGNGGVATHLRLHISLVGIAPNVSKGIVIPGGALPDFVPTIPVIVYSHHGDHAAGVVWKKNGPVPLTVRAQDGFVTGTIQIVQIIIIIAQNADHIGLLVLEPVIKHLGKWEITPANGVFGMLVAVPRSYRHVSATPYRIRRL